MSFRETKYFISKDANADFQALLYNLLCSQQLHVIQICTMTIKQDHSHMFCGPQLNTYFQARNLKYIIRHLASQHFIVSIFVVSLTLENPPLYLFADDFALCRDIPHPSDRQAAASSLFLNHDRITSWSNTWNMSFNPDKSKTHSHLPKGPSGKAFLLRRLSS